MHIYDGCLTYHNNNVWNTSFFARFNFVFYIPVHYFNLRAGGQGAGYGDKGGGMGVEGVGRFKGGGMGVEGAGAGYRERGQRRRGTGGKGAGII